MLRYKIRKKMIEAAYIIYAILILFGMLIMLEDDPTVPIEYPILDTIIIVFIIAPMSPISKILKIELY